jgi:Uma2 family endonuclease
MHTPQQLEKLILEADKIGVRLEIIGGLPVWETSPVYFHQIEIDRIRASIKPIAEQDCGCYHLADTLFRFQDGSLKRPDIAILCQRPKESEYYSALEYTPEAVVEVVSEGYEDKDLRFAPNFYLAQGVKDVLIYDPRAKLVWHHRVDGVERYAVPQEFSLECGCVVQV